MQSAFVDKDHWDTAVFSSNKNSVNKNKPELDLLTNDESCKKQAGTGTTDNNRRHTGGNTSDPHPDSAGKNRRKFAKEVPKIKI